MTEEAKAYHALRSVKERSFGELTRLRKNHGTWNAARDAEHISEDAAETHAKNLSRSGVRLILREDSSFPPLLKEIPHSPWAIYVMGTLKRDMKLLGIVGTRKATEGGKAIAREFAEKLAGTGLGIASGLALGIDRAAHTGALYARGYTVAVLANGLPAVYPKTNIPVAREILKSGGALISEYPPGETPRPHLFLERNRIISGLSQGILLVEASARSGSLATARFALEQNRDVFVVPGPSTHPNYSGSHELIRQGAELVTTPNHIKEAWGIASETPDKPEEPANAEESLILKALRGSTHPLSIDKITDLTHLETHTALRALSFLIIRGKAREEAGGFSSI